LRLIPTSGSTSRATTAVVARVGSRRCQPPFAPTATLMPAQCGQTARNYFNNSGQALIYRHREFSETDLDLGNSCFVRRHPTKWRMAGWHDSSAIVPAQLLGRGGKRDPAADISILFWTSSFLRNCLALGSRWLSWANRCRWQPARCVGAAYGSGYGRPWPVPPLRSCMSLVVAQYWRVVRISATRPWITALVLMAQAVSAQRCLTWRSSTCCDSPPLDGGRVLACFRPPLLCSARRRGWRPGRF